jgi:16S rRNA (guanine966-N2)-methyltransferase
MRIIAGALGGRNFVSPHSHRTRPMSDKVRGALFNSLGDIDGLEVLDAFAGSGALSYEALSRGAKRVVAIDIDKAAQNAIAENIKMLNLNNSMKLVKAGAGPWLSTTDQVFDIILCDPPYDDIQPKLLFKLADRLKHEGVIIFSLPPKADFSLSSNYELLTEKSYGDASLSFYKRLS